MKKSVEIPECHYLTEPTLVTPSKPTPKHTLYLSNLDEQRFLRFSIKYLYVFRQAVPFDQLRTSLSAILVHYYPLAGRLKIAGCTTGDHKEVGEQSRLEVDCNGKGAVMVEAKVDVSADELVGGSGRPEKSWRKLLYRVDAPSFIDVPPLVVQVTHLTCGGMILCTAINHCLCDGIGTSQFLHAWAQATANPMSDPPTTPFHDRTMLKPREPPQITFPHPEFAASPPTLPNSSRSLNQFLLSQPLTPTSLTFTSTHILHLKKQCTPSIKCTSFEILAAHVWRAWAKSLELPSTLQIKLLFSANVRDKINPNLPRGFYGNGFVLGCAETPVDQLLSSSPYYGIRLVQMAKQSLHDSHVRSVIDLLEETRSVPDMSATLVISAWSRLGLEHVDFGSGKPVHMGPLTSEIYCVFAPVVGDSGAINAIISVPQSVADRFVQYCIRGIEGRGEKDEIEGVNNNGTTGTGERSCCQINIAV